MEIKNWTVGKRYSAQISKKETEKMIVTIVTGLGGKLRLWAPSLSFYQQNRGKIWKIIGEQEN